MADIAAQESVTSNRYTILGRLAGGGMADIFLARVISEGGVQRHVVLKRVLAERSLDPQFAKMFLDEARLAAQLQHPNIAQLHDIGRLAGSYFYTMEYVHGEDLRAILANMARLGRPFPINLALLIAAHTLAALRHAHTRLGSDGRPLGVVHRDVTPSNVMVSYEGSVKLLDFGVAKAAQHTAESRSGTIKGKIAYLSPEQCQNADVDARSDLFSLGIVLHEMLVMRRLYRRDTDFATMMAIVNERPPPPSSFRPEISADLDQIVKKALAKDPAKRFSSAGDMLEAIETVAAQDRLVMSSTALGRFLCELVGERPEPWIELRATAEPTVITITGESVPEPAAMPGKSLLGRVPDFEAEAALQEQLAAAPLFGRPEPRSDDDQRSDDSQSTQLAPPRVVPVSAPPQPVISGQITASSAPSAPIRSPASGPVPKVVAPSPSGPLRVPPSGPNARPRSDATPSPRPLSVPPPTRRATTKPPVSDTLVPTPASSSAPVATRSPQTPGAGQQAATGPSRQPPGAGASEAPVSAPSSGAAGSPASAPVSAASPQSSGQPAVSAASPPSSRQPAVSGAMRAPSLSASASGSMPASSGSAAMAASASGSMPASSSGSAAMAAASASGSMPASSGSAAMAASASGSMPASSSGSAAMAAASASGSMPASSQGSAAMAASASGSMPASSGSAAMAASSASGSMPASSLLSGSAATPDPGTLHSAVSAATPGLGTPTAAIEHELSGRPTPPSGFPAPRVTPFPMHRGDPTAAVSPLAFEAGDRSALKRRVMIGAGVVVGLVVVIAIVASASKSKAPEDTGHPVVRAPAVTPDAPAEVQPPVDAAPAATPPDVPRTIKEQLDDAIAAKRWKQGLATCTAAAELPTSDRARCAIIACQANQPTAATSFYAAAASADRATRKAIEKSCRERGITVGARKPARDPCETNPLTCRK